MPVLIEGDCNFTDEEREFLAYVSSGDFPWYFGNATDNFHCLTHFLLKGSPEPVRGEQKSLCAPMAEKMFSRICNENGIEVRNIYRMSFNLTFSDPSRHGDPHKDHPHFSHKIMLIYLNQFDDGFTFLLDDKAERIVDKIVPGKDKFSVFDGDMHAQGFCRPQQHRMVMVITFDGDVIPKAEAA